MWKRGCKELHEVHQMVHKRCFDLQGSVKMAVSFVCKRCRHLVHANHDERVALGGDDLEVMDRFPILEMSLVWLEVCKKR